MKDKLITLLRKTPFLRLVYGLSEYLRAAQSAWRNRGKQPTLSGHTDGLPFPPPHLMLQVAGSTDRDEFLEGGRRATESLRELLGQAGLQLETFSAFLDFGCGCGRVIRHWYPLARTTQIYGTDYNPALIRWCRQHLIFAEFQTNQLRPPLAYAAASFDLVYAFSIFTHLPEAYQLDWMNELRRVLRPGGYLVLTVHGPSYLPSLSPAEQTAFTAGQLVVRYAEGAGTNLCVTYHPERYVREQLAQGYRVLNFIAEGAKGNPHQDIYLLQKLG